MLSAESQVDVILDLLRNIGLTNIELSSSVRSLGPQPVRVLNSVIGPKSRSYRGLQGCCSLKVG